MVGSLWYLLLEAKSHPAQILRCLIDISLRYNIYSYFQFALQVHYKQTLRFMHAFIFYLQDPNTLYYISTTYAKVWDSKLQISVICTVFSIFPPCLCTAWWMILSAAETCNCLLTYKNICCVEELFVGLVAIHSRLGPVRHPKLRVSMCRIFSHKNNVYMTSLSYKWPLCCRVLLAVHKIK